MPKSALREVHVGDIGTSFEVTVKDGKRVVDVSTASNMQILFKKPDGTTLTKVALHKTDGTDGVIYYATLDGDLDIKGTWKIQARVTLPTGTWRSDVKQFRVFDNLI